MSSLLNIPYFNRKKKQVHLPKPIKPSPGIWLEVKEEPKPKPTKASNPILDLPTPDYNYIAHEAKAKRLKERLAKAEANKIPDPLLYLPTSWVKANPLKGKKQPKPKPIKPPEIQKPPKPKGPQLRERLTNIADSPIVPKLVVFGITSISFMVVAVFLVLAIGLPILLLAPQLIVGSAEEVVAQPAVKLTTIPTVPITPAGGWSPTPYRIPVEVWDYKPIPKTTPTTPPIEQPTIPTPTPPAVVPTPPTPTLPVVSVTNTTKTFLIGGKERDPNSIPTMYRWQYTFPCYWELRDLGYGKELSVEYACNSQDTGLWIKACECCKLMGKC
jgi:hypothetical protein